MPSPEVLRYRALSAHNARSASVRKNDARGSERPTPEGQQGERAGCIPEGG